MVAPVFEHITAIIVVSMLFVSAVIAVPAINYVNLLYVDQQQLRNVALDVLNSMLLNIGSPSNWGADFDNIDKFGLALHGSSSFYVLDSEKVERLSSSNPSGYLNYENVSTLLGLQNYGFNIRIMPLFNVTVDDMSQDNELLFNVNVRFNDERPIPTASVTATIFYVSGKKSDNFNFTTPSENRTNEVGECMISYTLPSDFIGYILVLKVTVADMATVTVPYIQGFSQTVANASIIGDTVTVWIPESEHPSERVIHNVTVVTANDVWNYPNVGCGRLPEDKMTSGEGFAEWIQNFPGINYEDALFLIFNIWTQEDPGAKHFVLFATSPLLDVRSGLLQLKGQPSAQSSDGAVLKLSRSVEIAGMTYIFEILIWKEV
jgi:hypothetical protein